MTRVSKNKFLQALFLTTALVSGNTLYAMQDEELTSPSLMHPEKKQRRSEELLAIKDVTLALPILAKKMSNLTSYFQNLSPEEVALVLPRTGPYQDKFWDANQLRSWIEEVKSPTEIEWISLEKRKEPFKENLNCIDSTRDFIHAQRNKSHEEWDRDLNRLLSLKTKVKSIGAIIAFANLTQNFDEEKWDRVCSFDEKLQNDGELLDFIAMQQNISIDQWMRVKPLLKNINNFLELQRLLEITNALTDQQSNRLIFFQGLLEENTGDRRPFDYKVAKFCRLTSDLTDEQWKWIEYVHPRDLFALKKMQKIVVSFKDQLADIVDISLFVRAIGRFSEKNLENFQQTAKFLKEKLGNAYDFIYYFPTLNDIGEVPYDIVPHFLMKVDNIDEIRNFFRYGADFSHKQWNQIISFKEKLHNMKDLNDFLLETKILSARSWNPAEFWNRLLFFKEKIRDLKNLYKACSIIANYSDSQWSLIEKRYPLFETLILNYEDAMEVFFSIMERIPHEKWPRFVDFRDKLNDLSPSNVRLFSRWVLERSDEEWNTLKNITNDQWNLVTVFLEKCTSTADIKALLETAIRLTKDQWMTGKERVQIFNEKLKTFQELIQSIEDLSKLTDQEWERLHKRILPYENQITAGDIHIFAHDVVTFTDDEWDGILKAHAQQNNRIPGQELNEMEDIVIAEYQWHKVLKPVFPELLSLRDLTEPRTEPYHALMPYLVDNPLSEQVKIWLQHVFLQGDSPAGDILVDIARVFGVDHPITQEFIQFALGLDNQNDPTGFLTIHQELLRKAVEPVQHKPRIMENLTLNLDIIKEPRPRGDVPMIQVALWEKLLTQYEKFVETHRAMLVEMGSDVDFSNLFALKDNVFLRNLLDANTLRTGIRAPIQRTVSTTSYEFRKCIEHICQSQVENEVAAMLELHQLLLNIQTCTTGKETGISQTHRIFKNEKILEEDQLGTELFQKEIVNFFKEELRRMREAVVPQILAHLKLRSDPHYIHYIRGILGAEVGLFFKDEKSPIDINGNNLPSVLRNQSKQALLSIFYLYYKPEDVIARVHTMLNNGSISISGKKGDVLTTALFNMYFSDQQKYDPLYTVFDKDETPIGLTPLAAQKLLQELGFLVPVEVEVK